MLVNSVYELTLEKRPQYVFGRVTAAAASKETAFCFLNEAADFCRDNGEEKLLLIRDIPDVLCDSSIYFMADDLARVTQELKLAVVNPHPQLEGSLKFVETATANRGARNKIFTNQDDAEQWLCDE